MLPIVPGQIATVLVAFAVTEFSPSQISAGNESSVPPPAMELIAPARNADAKATEAVNRVKFATNLPAYYSSRDGRGERQFSPASAAHPYPEVVESDCETP